ncbi:hypothetical protein [Halanaerobaculum tunisiense]
MPKLNGKAIPVVMLSSVTIEGKQTTIQALELGAFEAFWFYFFRYR